MNEWLEAKPWFCTDIILNRQFQKFLTTHERQRNEKHHQTLKPSDFLFGKHPDVLKSVSACWGIIFLSPAWIGVDATDLKLLIGTKTLYVALLFREQMVNLTQTSERDSVGLSGNSWHHVRFGLRTLHVEQTQIIELMSGSIGNHSVSLSNEADVSLYAVCHGVLVFVPWGTLGGWSCSFNCF